MKSNVLWWSVRTVGVLALTASIGAFADGPSQERFSGLIESYSPQTVSPTGPWEVRGVWTLKLKGDSGTADFSAALSMVRTDFWVLKTGANPDTLSLRVPHTHHVTMEYALVTAIPNGFRVSGPADVTGSGNPAPFGPSSTLQVDITGGSVVEFSNIALTFGGDAAAHFGTQTLTGVVRGSK